MKFQITDPRIALIFMGLFAIISGAIVTYINAVLTTLEKRFELSSTEMGALIGANDIGYLTCVIFVAYIGSKKSRQPRLLGISGIGLWLSCMIYAFPYFIYGSKYNAQSLLEINVSDQKGLCLNYTKISTLINTGSEYKEINSSEKSLAMFILMIAGIINGVSSTPFWNIGISFLDDMGGPKKSGIFIGAMFAIRTCSPIFGFLLGSHILKFDESLKLRVFQYLPGQKDPKWIGAWWLGWVILGFCMLIPTPFILLFKTKQKKPTEEEKDMQISLKNADSQEDHNPTRLNSNIINSKNEAIDMNSKKTSFSLITELKSIFKLIKEAFSNKIFSSLLIGMVFEIISFVCLVTFFTKFLEYHYRVSTSLTNIMSALCLSGSSMLSALISGGVSYFYKTSLRNMNGYHAIVNTWAALLFPILFLFACQSTEIHGLNEQSKISMCSDKCFCQETQLTPVCYNSSTYFSPCIAGCTAKLNDSFFANCGCQGIQLAQKGFCEKMCLSVYGFLIAYFLIRIIGSIASVQFTQLLMRLGNPNAKGFNLSLVGFLYGICGLTLPPLAGAVLDTACIQKNVNSFGVQSHCLIYDNDKMRNLIIGVSFAFQIPACLLYIYSWRCMPPDYAYKDKKIEENKDITERL